MQPHPAISDFSIRPPRGLLENIEDTLIPFYRTTAIPTRDSVQAQLPKRGP